MNIFLLSYDPRKAARYMADKHVIKMILETAQLLCTAHHETGSPREARYKSTHKNHPCAIWARASAANYDWLVEHGLELCREYTFRYGKLHKSTEVLEWLAKYRPDLPDIGLTPFAICMPDHCKIEGKPVASYRKYYRIEKAEITSWKNRKMPNWYRQG